MREEFIHHIIEQLAEKDVSYYQEAFEKGQLDYLIVRIMLNQLNSKYSQWYQKFIKNDRENATAIEKFEEKQFDDDNRSYDKQFLAIEDPKLLVDIDSYTDFEDKYDEIVAVVFPEHRAIGSPDWYIVNLSEMHFLHGKTIKQITSETEISDDSIYRTLRQYKKAISNYIYS